MFVRVGVEDELDTRFLLGWSNRRVDLIVQICCPTQKAVDLRAEQDGPFGRGCGGDHFSTGAGARDRLGRCYTSMQKVVVKAVGVNGGESKGNCLLICEVVQRG